MAKAKKAKKTMPAATKTSSKTKNQPITAKKTMPQAMLGKRRGGPMM